MTVKLKQILVVIFLGSLGSGLWDLFLKDALFSLGNVFVLFFSSLSSGYLDSLYENVGVRRDGIIIFPGIMLLLLFCFLPTVVFILVKRRTDELDELCNIAPIEKNDEDLSSKQIEKAIGSLQKKWKVIKFFLLMGSIFVSLMYVDLTITFLSEYKAQSVVERRLEIIRPYIPEREFYILKSDSRLISDLLTLQKLINKTEFIAVDNNLKMPEFRLYGVTLPELRN